MSYATFLADPLRQDIFLVEIDAYRKSDGATETLRFSSDEFATLPSETPASTVYDPCVKEGFNLTTGDAPPGRGMPRPGERPSKQARMNLASTGQDN